MKTRILISIVMFLCFACTRNKPLTDSEKQKITGEVREVTAQILKLAEQADIDGVMAMYYDTPDNIILSPDGKPMTFNEWKQMFNTLFAGIKNQKITTLIENYRVLDRTTVWYTSVSKARLNFKDSSILMQNPWSSFMLFKKIDDTWKLAGITEWGYEEVTKPAPLSKELNQIELAKKGLGRWKCEYGDTVAIFDQQPFGDAQVVSIRTTVKGKPFREDRQLWCFDRIHDRMTFMQSGRSADGMVVSLKFNTPTTYTTIPYNNISNPAYAPFRIEGEYINPDTYVEKVIVNNETTRTFTTKRIK